VPSFPVETTSARRFSRLACAGAVFQCCPPSSCFSHQIAFPDQAPAESITTDSVFSGRVQPPSGTSGPTCRINGRHPWALIIAGVAGQDYHAATCRRRDDDKIGLREGVSGLAPFSTMSRQLNITSSETGSMRCSTRGRFCVSASHWLTSRTGNRPRSGSISMSRWGDACMAAINNSPVTNASIRNASFGISARARFKS
jgi:hypothetical protein